MSVGDTSPPRIRTRARHRKIIQQQMEEQEKQERVDEQVSFELSCCTLTPRPGIARVILFDVINSLQGVYIVGQISVS